MSISRTRVLKVLNNEIPDRVPLMELLISPHVIQKMHPGMDYNQFCMAEDYDFIFVKRDFKTIWLDKEKGIYRNEWGIIRKTGPEETDDYLEGPIKEINDLKKFKVPNPEDEKNFKSLKEAVKKYKKDKFIVFLSKATFNFPWALVGSFQQYLIELYTNPAFIYSLHKMVQEHHEILNKRAIEIGADAIALVDDYAYRDKLFLSREKFIKFCLPSIKNACETSHKNNSFLFFHSDGNLNEIMDLITEAGIDFLHPIEPGAMDIKEIHKKYKKNCVICGNVNCADTLTFGRPEDVKREVLWLLENIAPEGRYIMSSSNTIHSRVKPENLRTFIDTLKRHGRY